MSAQNIFSRSTTEPSPTSRFREHARAFIYRNRWVAFVELLMLALLFAVPFFTFSSGILGLPFVLLILWLLKSNIQDLGFAARHHG